jgi:allantoicase
LKADNRHFYEKEILNPGPWTHIRLNIAPDGGVSRLRVHGVMVKNERKPATAGSAAKSK